MTKSYNIRGGVEDISDSSTTTESVKQASKEATSTFSLNASFSRGKLYLLEEKMIFVQSLTESTVKNFVNSYLSKGPVDLQTIGLYNPYKAPLEKAGQGESSWEVSYSDIEAVSLLKKGNGYEIFLRPSGDPGYLYRIRTQGGNDYIGFRWLYSPNHDTAVQMAGEIYDQVNRYGSVEIFDAGSNSFGRTKQVEFSKGKSEYADKETVEQPRSSTEVGETTDTVTPEATETSTSDSEPEEDSETTKNNHSQSKVTQSKSDAPDQQETTDTKSYQPDWIDSSKEFESGFQVRNNTNEEKHVISTYRINKETVFDLNTTIDPNHSFELYNIPEGEFEIGIATSDGKKTARKFNGAVLTEQIEAIITEENIDFVDPNTEQNRSKTEETVSQTNADSSDSVESESSRTEINGSNTVDKTNKSSESTDSVSTTENLSVSSLPLLMLIISVFVVIAIPFSGILEFAESTRSQARYVVAATPTPFAIFVGAVLAFPDFGSAPILSDLAKTGIIVMGIAIPATLIIDLLHVRERTEWNPNRILYPLGAMLIWPLTLLIYFYRRQKAVY